MAKISFLGKRKTEKKDSIENRKNLHKLYIFVTIVTDDYFDLKIFEDRKQRA